MGVMLHIEIDRAVVAALSYNFTRITERRAMKILIVEDDSNIALGPEEVLKTAGFEPLVCRRGDKALDAVTSHEPGLIILDIMLPGLSGFDICKQLRAKSITSPVIMLTAKGQEIDKVMGLEFGADDYMTKPFGVQELLARVHALLRRANTAIDDAIFQIGSAIVDCKTFQLRVGKTVHELTAKEVKLLKRFHEKRGQVLSREKLLRDVWGYNYYGTTRTLDQVIVQLRKKLGDSRGEPKHLLTVHGVGYKLVD
jgi:DNA-binding response OmpR family regulator